MKSSKTVSLLIVFICYVLAIGIAYLFIINYKNNDNLFFTIFYADLIATIIIYSCSYIFNNSSIYDPYWSVIPPFILLFWVMLIDNINVLNLYLLSFSVLFWSIRLTFNWARGWKGLLQEDWRYIDLKNNSGKFYQLVNFSGIHFFPTVIVFVCCIPFKYALENNNTDISIILGFIICFIGVLYEIIADHQLYQFKKIKPNNIINKGLWKYSRHPNYYGEILFWWGLFFYGLINVSYLYLIIYPILMTLMFLFISIPWIEKKILSTRPQYSEYQKAVNILLPEITFFKKLFR